MGVGESRISELRSGHSKDVIFNGSGSRAAAGRASVELVFDNSDGALKGCGVVLVRFLCNELLRGWVF